MNKFDYLIFLTSCENIYKESYLDIQNIFSFNDKKTELLFNDDWDIDNAKNGDIFGNIFFSPGKSKTQYIENKLLSNEVDIFLKNKLKPDKIIDCIEIDASNALNYINNLISSPEIIILKRITFLWKNIYINCDYLLIKNNTITLYIFKKTKKLHNIYNYEASYLFYSLLKLGIKLSNINFILINGEVIIHNSENFFITDKMNIKKTAVIPEQISETNTRLLDAIINQSYNFIKRKKQSEQKLNLLEKYNFFIEHFSNLKKLISKNFQYKKSICNGSIAKCKFFELCKAKYLVKNNKFLDYNQKSFSKNTIIDKLPKDYELAAENFRERYRYLVSNKNNVWMNKELFIQNSKQYYNAEKLIWFDFETFIIPFILEKIIPPYTQIPFQCSIIKTNAKNKLLESKNLINDPCKNNINFFIKILNELYSPGNNKYVVYNKSFEIKVIKKIASIINKKEYYKIAEEIISNILDLMDFFNAKNGNPPIYQNKLLKGKFSIKYINDYLKQYHANYLNKYNVSDYLSLDVKNGAEASSIARERFYNVLSEKQWESKTKQLKKYCNNDVASMISTYDYLQNL